MSIRKKLFGEKERAAGPGGMKSEDVIQVMLANGEAYLKEGMEERAFDTYKEIAELTPNVTAQYNLGVLFATGRGTGQDFLQAAYWFHQAARQGDESAARLRTKCTMDYLHENFDRKSPEELYLEMERYGKLLYPEKDVRETGAANLYELGAHHMNRQEYGQAAKLFRAAAQFCDDGRSQNDLAVLYNAGAGVEKNDLAALYWFDRAADQGVQAAKADRDGIFQSYVNSLGRQEFGEQLELMAECCQLGSPHIPRDEKKAAYWKKQGESLRK